MRRNILGRKLDHREFAEESFRDFDQLEVSLFVAIGQRLRDIVNIYSLIHDVIQENLRGLVPVESEDQRLGDETLTQHFI